MPYYFICFGCFICLSTSFIDLHETTEAVRELSGIILVCAGYIMKEIRKLNDKKTS